MAKILLCDDSKTILALFEKKLQAAGHEIVGKASDGEEGFKLYAEKRPDLALLDITMPNKDGRECLENILKLHPSAKVIMVSALQDAAVMDGCLKGGAKAFIQKSKIYDDAEFAQAVLPLIDGVLKAA